MVNTRKIHIETIKELEMKGVIIDAYIEDMTIAYVNKVDSLLSITGIKEGNTFIYLVLDINGKKDFIKFPLTIRNIGEEILDDLYMHLDIDITNNYIQYSFKPKRCVVGINENIDPIDLFLFNI